MGIQKLRDYMAKVDVGQTLHRFTNYLIVALISVVIYFVKKADEKLDTVCDKVNTHETKIEVHNNQISNINFQLGEIKQRQELRQKGM